MSPIACSTDAVDIVDIRQNDVEFSLVNEIYAGIDPPAGTKRSMPTMLLYNAEGLKLFEEITYLDEYYLTNAEIEVLQTHAKRIAERVPHNAQLLELGSGYIESPSKNNKHNANRCRNLRKIKILLDELDRTGKSVDYYALDLSLSELQRTFAEVSVDDFNHVGLHGLHGTYDDALAWLKDPQNRKRPTVILTLGSSIGNFDRSAAAEFLTQYSKLLGPSDMLVVGLDGCKDPERVHKAYNDSQGITRRFYENGLHHANTVLGYEAFKPDEWEVITGYDSIKGCHQAAYSPRTDVTINGIFLPKGERFGFEEAYKYSPEERDQLWRSAGLIHCAEFGNSSGDYRTFLSALNGLMTSDGVICASLG